MSIIYTKKHYQDLIFLSAFNLAIYLKVRIKGLEPSLLSELEPKSSASANFAISASIPYLSTIKYLWQ